MYSNQISFYSSVLIFDKSKVYDQRGEKCDFRSLSFSICARMCVCVYYFIMFFFLSTLFMYEIKRSIYHFHPPYIVVYTWCVYLKIKSKNEGKEFSNLFSFRWIFLTMPKGSETTVKECHDCGQTGEFISKRIIAQ